MSAVSSVTLWMLGAACLAGGFAAGYVVGHGGDALPDDAPPPLERGTDSRPSAAPVRTLERPEAPPADEAHLDSTRAAALAPIRDLLDGMPPPEIPRGNGVISGSVKTPEGKGVAGVEITLHPQRPGTGARRDEDVDLPVAVQQAIDAVRWRRLARQQTVTGADGTYRFDAVADLDHSLEPKLDGWRFHPADPRRAWQVRPGAELDFVARAVARIQVTVVLPDGTTPDTAMVMMKQGGTYTGGVGWTKQQGWVELQPGTWELTATAGDAQEYKSDPQTITVEQGAAPTPLRFELKSSGGIHGSIQYAPGEPFQQGRVYLARIPKGEKADPARLASSETNTHLNRWNPSGPTFAYPDLPPGRYVLGLSRSWQGPIVVTQEVEVADEAVEVVLKVPPLEREEYVVVDVRDPTGEPLAGTQITVGRKSKNGSSSSGATVIEREDGTKWVLHHEGDADADATWWVEAHHPQYGTVRKEYSRTRASVVDLRFGKPGTIEVTVTGLAGTRYEGRIRASLTGTRSNAGGLLDGSGRVTLSGVQPGAYRVLLRLGGDRGRSSPIHAQAVEVRAGENPVRIAMPPLYEVEILGAEGRTWLRSTGRGPTRYSQNLTAAVDGRVAVDGLPAGEYEVRSGRKRATFRVPGTTRVQLE